jgi:small subunit ribosomal protein S20
MANTKSAQKAIRQSERHRLHNKYYAKTTRNAIRDLRNTTDKKTAEEHAPKVYAMIDKLAKIGVIHANKAANLKSGLALYINKLS